MPHTPITSPTRRKQSAMQEAEALHRARIYGQGNRRGRKGPTLPDLASLSDAPLQEAADTADCKIDD